jgi:hypothetical protein
VTWTPRAGPSSASYMEGNSHNTRPPLLRRSPQTARLVSPSPKGSSTQMMNNNNNNNRRHNGEMQSNGYSTLQSPAKIGSSPARGRGISSLFPPSPDDGEWSHSIPLIHHVAMLTRSSPFLPLSQSPPPSRRTAARGQNSKQQQSQCTTSTAEKEIRHVRLAV